MKLNPALAANCFHSINIRIGLFFLLSDLQKSAGLCLNNSIFAFFVAHI
jgi:hypothetical protein